MTKSSLARVRWQVTLVEHEPAQSPGWKLVDDIRKLSDEVHEVELLLESPELQKADFEDFSKQEDKLKVSCEIYRISDLKGAVWVDAFFPSFYLHEISFNPKMLSQDNSASSLLVEILN